MSDPNRAVKKKARQLAAAEGIRYTTALRRVTNTSPTPEEELRAAEPLLGVTRHPVPRLIAPPVVPPELSDADLRLLMSGPEAVNALGWTLRELKGTIEERVALIDEMSTLLDERLRLIEEDGRTSADFKPVALLNPTAAGRFIGELHDWWTTIKRWGEPAAIPALSKYNQMIRMGQAVGIHVVTPTLGATPVVDRLEESRDLTQAASDVAARLRGRLQRRMLTHTIDDFGPCPESSRGHHLVAAPRRGEDADDEPAERPMV